MKTSLIIVLLAAAFCRLNAQDAGEIAEKAENVIEFDALEMISTLNIHDHRGNVRTRQVAVATCRFGKVTKTMIRFLSPADVRGTGMLVYDYEEKGDDMWIYMPALRRTRRIVAGERSASFMGSEFTNADMGSRNLDDFNYSLQGSEVVEGRECWIVESVPKTKDIKEESGFNKMVAYIDKESFHTCKVEYYDLNDELHRIMTIGDYRQQANGKYFAFKMEVQNVQNNRKSVMVVDRFQPGSDLDESSFTVSALENF